MSQNEPAALSDQLPELLTSIPGPRSLALTQRLIEVESQNVTCVEPIPPIFIQRARGSNLWDVDGNRFIDLGAAFGVAATGHSHPQVVQAMAEQSGELLHGMGDVYPSASKVELLEALASRFPGGAAAKGVLSSSGSDAVETAIKTAMLASGKPGILAFEGAYHGLSLGVLDVTWRSHFRSPFSKRLPHLTRFARFGDIEDVRVKVKEDSDSIGAILVEPIQGRGGERIPPAGFLRALRELCDNRGLLLIADEIYTGCGRTGRFFACEHEEVVPDLLCVGKGLASGMPLSACMGKSEVMDHWPRSRGEAIHTQTFIGHPPGCAAALAALRIIDEQGLVDRSEQLGAEALAYLKNALSTQPGIIDVRGRGLMLGIEFESGQRALAACDEALQQGVVLLASGDQSQTLGITPPLSIERDLFFHALDLLIQCIS
ncbi:MAG: aminotransferase class III-fold pyridoxal phosphate-dependent enzyme [Deltaproteobacteria bacterium]|nr:aminotransferase class III-fold pyridoxal phosphate-dependent enzyme [Deltaproteobacteria bacterium]